MSLNKPLILLQIVVFVVFGCATKTQKTAVQKVMEPISIEPLKAGVAKNTSVTKYGVTALYSMDEYRNLVAQDSSKALVDLAIIIPSIKLDIRYATTNNFMKRVMYPQAKAFLALPAANALKAVQKNLNDLGYALNIYDAYRPYSITVDFYEKVKDTTFVASAYKGSRHNRGCAVDLSIIDLQTGKEVAMPTPFDDFSPKAHTNYSNLPADVISNRELLKKVMLQSGFELYADEWWHYDYKGWRDHPIIDIPFDVLSQTK